MATLSGRPFTNGLETERIPGEFRLVRGGPVRVQPFGGNSDSRKGLTTMAEPEGKDPGDTGLVFAAQNNHDPRCGRPPRVRNTDNPERYHGYFENRYGEQFIFTFDRATQLGTVSGGDLGWDDPKEFTLGLLDEVLRGNRKIAAQVVEEGRDETTNLPVIDAAQALGRLAGLTGKDEVLWMRACLEACVSPAERPEEYRLAYGTLG
jgi:hypothetical protein